MVELYAVDTYRIKAQRQLEENIREMLRKRGQTQADLARSIINPKTGRAFTEVWISGILRQNRGLPLKYLDAIANFFGIMPYQLFQPGISPLTERRRRERRSGTDRRIAAMDRPPTKTRRSNAQEPRMRSAE